jgi:hypothetical protein
MEVLMPRFSRLQTRLSRRGALFAGALLLRAVPVAADHDDT